MSDVTFTVVAERVQYYDKDGKLITESLKDYTRSTVQEEFATLDDFLQALERRPTASRRSSTSCSSRACCSRRCEDRSAGTSTPFDLICHVAFDQPPLTRRERADNVRKRDVFAKYGEQARAVLDALLDKYADEGLDAIEDDRGAQARAVPRARHPVELVRALRRAATSTSPPSASSKPRSTNAA